ncbi:DHRS4 [Lepeophtheirus salmonis]|uniref:DHRS4 n=1 Tax=Lepeophtheirus salmonis TaxID=72036 RepID=A0A7R8H3Z9_LEPSM|nr:DHRS4 [Lepeophtheirus salmonis]CAF2849498.1 DHRS4 [Lepeophtheirus salmonis]
MGPPYDRSRTHEALGGKLDILVSNEAVNPRLDTSQDAWDKIMDINVKIPFCIGERKGSVTEQFPRPFHNIHLLHFWICLHAQDVVEFCSVVSPFVVPFFLKWIPGEDEASCFDLGEERRKVSVEGDRDLASIRVPR